MIESKVVPLETLVVDNDKNEVSLEYDEQNDTFVDFDDTYEDFDDTRTSFQVTKLSQISDEHRHSFANKNLAYEHRRRHRINQGPTKNFAQFPICWFRDEQFTKFGGVGTYLYFRFLRNLKWLFFALTAISVPQIVLSIWSNSLPNSSLHLEQTMLGNIFGREPDDKKNLGLIISYLNCFGTLCFLWFLSHTKKSQARETTRANDNTVSAADYTVRVRNLPPRAVKRTDLKEFFNREKWGKVADVAVCYDDSELIELYGKRGDLRDQVAAATVRRDVKAVHSLEKKIQKVQKEIDDFRKYYQQRAVQAFVTFNDETSTEKVIKAFNVPWYKRCCVRGDLKYDGKLLHVDKAPEPSNIIFHNLRYSKSHKRAVRAFTLATSLLLIGISMVIILVAVQYQSTLPRSEECDGVEFDDLDELFDLEYEFDDNAKTIDCYCQERGPIAIARSRELQELCTNYLYNVAIVRGLFIAISLGVAFINILLGFIVQFLVTLEKHTSASDEELATLKKVFVATFVNTGLILTLANANTKKEFGFSLFRGRYDDFEPSWYTVIGISLTLTMIINMLNPHIWTLISMLVSKCKRKCTSVKDKTQQKLDEVFIGPKFVLSYRYAAIANVIFVSFIYSPGIPILLGTSCVTFLFIYWFDRIALLRFYRKPPMFDESIAVYITSLCRIAVYLHTLFAIWMYGSPSILEHYVFDFSYIGVDMSLINFPLRRHIWEAYGERLFNWTVFPHILLFVYLLCIDVLNPILELTGFFKCRCSRKIHKHPEQITYLQALQEGNELESYLISHQEQYENAFIEPTDEGYQKQIPLYEYDIQVAEALANTTNMETLSPDEYYGLPNDEEMVEQSDFNGTQSEENTDERSKNGTNFEEVDDTADEIVEEQTFDNANEAIESNENTDTKNNETKKTTIVMEPVE